MIGLLWKDYAQTHAKALFMVLVLGTCGIAALCLTNSGAPEIEVLIPIMIALFLVLGAGYVLYSLGGQLIASDEGRKQRDYLLCLPVSKKEYVASKYIFLLAAYLLVALTALVLVPLGLHCLETDSTLNNMRQIRKCILPTLSAFVLISAIELPLYLRFGTQKGNAIKAGLVVTLFLAAVGYLLVGDLSVFDWFSLEKFAKWTERHPNLMHTIQIISPVVAMAAYTGSYMLSSMLFGRREAGEE